MRKYEEPHYLYENIRTKIYPWVKTSLIDHMALNGKSISEKDTPLVAFVGELLVCFVIQREHGQYEIVKDNMLQPECDIEALYHVACQNLVRDIDFVISHTMYGGFGIVADGHHEASAILYKHIWKMCCEKIQDDLVIMVPSKDMLLFVPASDIEGIGKMMIFGQEAYNRNLDKISEGLYLFSKDKEELSVYVSEG